LGEVCDYIHLNPVRAGICDVEGLTDYRFSSYWYLRSKSERPDFLKPQTALVCAGGLPDNSHGWAAYAARLKVQTEEIALVPAKRKRQRQRLSRRWVVGSDLFRAALIKDHNLAASVRAWATPGAQEIRALKWSAALQQGLQILGKNAADLLSDRKSAPWKIALAVWLKGQSLATNRWLCQTLNLGIPSALSRNAANYRSRLQQADPLWKRLTAISLT